MDSTAPLTTVLAGRDQAVARLHYLAEPLATAPIERGGEALMFLQPVLELDRQAALVLRRRVPPRV